MAMHKTLHRESLRAFKQLFFACLTALVVMAQANSASAELVKYSFDGEVTSLSPSTATPFGLTIPTGSLVTGQFQYETTSTAENTTGDIRYLQSIANGFTATIAGFPVSASDYYFIVANREEPSVEDFVTIRFSTFLSPALPSTNFFVDGINRTAATFAVKLSTGVNILTNMDLPSPTVLQTFVGGTSFLTDTSPALGARFRIDSLTRISAPEPDAMVLFLAGMMALSATAARRRLLARG
jgi:hypothetical protein